MRIRDIIYYLSSDMRLIVKSHIRSTDETIDIYDGKVQDLPYWIAEKSFTASECIEVENNAIVIDISKPVKNENIEPILSV